MAHYAKIDKNNIIQDIIVAEQDFINSGAVGDSFNWIQTSYNSNFRNKYASIGDTWRPDINMFISPSPYESWKLNENTGFWEAPVEKPNDGKYYIWNENNKEWVESEADKI